MSDLCDGHNVQNGHCFACKFGLKLNQGKCLDLNCQEFEGEKCKSCKQNFKKDSNSICKEFDKNCLEDFNGRCQNCQTGYYVNTEGKCRPLPQNCAFANMMTGDCLECVDGYEMR